MKRAIIFNRNILSVFYVSLCILFLSGLPETLKRQISGTFDDLVKSISDYKGMAERVSGGPALYVFMMPEDECRNGPILQV
jgi:hypothetical protein